MRRYAVLTLCALFFASIGTPNRAQPTEDEIRIAVASNFSTAMSTLAEEYEERTGRSVILSYGSTGKHFAQIKNGAPFDAFFAADVRRPRLLEKEGAAVPGTRFTYAVGKLVLWSPNPGLIDPAGKFPEIGSFRFLAIANPALAPYGAAAREVLQRLGLWERLSSQIVRGENVTQAFQYVQTGNAELGFVACSQIMSLDQTSRGSIWEVPPDLYSPIEQQAVLLRDRPGARDFLEFVRSSEARNIIRSHGYETFPPGTQKSETEDAQ